MTKDYFIKLTFTVYQASESWSEKNLLKQKMRNLANEILSDFILFSQENSANKSLQIKILKEIHEVKEVFSQARSQKCLDRNKFLLFREEYNNLKKRLEEQNFVKDQKEVKKEKNIQVKTPSKKELNGRQKKILEILKGKEKAQVQDLQVFFPAVTKRTLRRDLDSLLKAGLIERGGEWNKVFYKLYNFLTKLENTLEPEQEWDKTIEG